MAADVPDSFNVVFAELRRVHHELCTNMSLQLPIIESLILKASQAEVAKACRAEGLQVGVSEDMEVPCEHHWKLDAPYEDAWHSEQLTEPMLQIVEPCGGSHSKEAPVYFNEKEFLVEGAIDWKNVENIDSDLQQEHDPLVFDSSSATQITHSVENSRTGTDFRVVQKAGSSHSLLSSSLMSGAKAAQHGSLRSSYSSAYTSTFSMAPSTQSSTLRGMQSFDDLSECGEYQNIRRWARVVEKLLPAIEAPGMRTRLRPIFANDVRAGWLKALTKSHSNFLLEDRLSSTRESGSTPLFAGSMIIGQSRVQRLIIHPDSVLARLVLMLSGLALLYDLVTVPLLLCFAMAETGWIQSMDLVLTIFWTCDMMASAWTGYHSNAVVEMRPMRVITHYFRTWGFLDLFIVASDWTRYILSHYDINTATGSILSAGRAFKYYRFLRIIRMFRIFKLFQLFVSHIDGFATEVSLVIGKLVGLVVMMILINHYIACFWYALAVYNTEDGVTWPDDLDYFDPSDKSHAYVVSIHWAMTQFTPATNNVSPMNLRERVFAFFVVLFALIIFSSFLGSLTSAISQLKQIHVERYSEEAKIRRFLQERKVSIESARKVWQCYRSYHMTNPTGISFGDISFFKTLPRKLRIALHQDLSIPTLSTHPALYFLDKHNNDLLLHLCDATLTEVSQPAEHEVFSTGAICDSMIFLTYGTVHYDSALYMKLEDLKAPQFISEVAVWAAWAHRGTLNTGTACNVIAMDVKRFGSVIRMRAEQDTFSALKTYAKGFINVSNDMMMISDIVPAAMASSFRKKMHKIAAEAFETMEQDQIKRTSFAWSTTVSATISVGSWRRRVIQFLTSLPFRDRR